MDSEKQRQVSTLENRIAERKRKRAAAMARKHDAEMSRELMKQQAERNVLEKGQVSSFCSYLQSTTFYLGREPREEALPSLSVQFLV